MSGVSGRTNGAARSASESLPDFQICSQRSAVAEGAMRSGRIKMLSKTWDVLPPANGPPGSQGENWTGRSVQRFRFAQ